VLPASEHVPLLPLQGMVLPEDMTWKGVEQWLRRRGAGGEVLLVFENTEDVLLHDRCAGVRGCAFMSCTVYCALV
jgi:hypothetical protein